jgi:dihydroorotase
MSLRSGRSSIGSPSRPVPDEPGPARPAGSSAPADGPPADGPPADGPPPPAADLVIRGGTVIDPAAGRHGPADVAIANGRIVAVGDPGDIAAGARSIDARGKLVLPGLIDLHTHAFHGYHGADPDVVSLPRGTTTAIDGGSSGANAFGAFRSLIAERSRTRMGAWLNISTIGLIDIRVGELLNLLHVDVEAAVRVAEANRDLVVGFKIRISEYVAGSDFRPALRLARQAADATRLPIMVHIGDTDAALPVALSFLVSGDVITHTFSGRRHGILDGDGIVLAAVRAARAAGIQFDGAHGRRHFAFATVRRALDQGFMVDTLSSDISSRAAADPTYHLPLILSKLMAVGARLEDVVPLVTSHPARFLGREAEIGTLQPGAAADVAILERVEGDVMLRDSDGEVLAARERLRPWRTIRAGQITDAPADS